MAWQEFAYSTVFDLSSQTSSQVGGSKLNDQCFIRKQHKCGKMFGASKSCFIACPTDSNLEPILGLMSEKLSKLGIEPIIAVKERAYGQDIFCTKICGKIIESRFCIVILDDTIRDNKNIPNPNVYYEYGLMTALRKHIVPLQKEELVLAFNIQSYDTIKYNGGNVGTELERAIRDAVKITETIEAKKRPEAIADKAILRRLEMSGFKAKDEEWFLSNVVGDTAFRGFGHGKEFYAFIGKIDSANDMQMYLDDLSVAVYRIGAKVKEIESEISLLEFRARKIIPNEDPTRIAGLPRIKIEIHELKSRLKFMSIIYVGFVVASDYDVEDFLKSVERIIAGQDRYHLASFNDGKMTFGDICVDFTASQSL